MIASQHPLACSIIYVAIKANLLFGYNVLQLQPLAGQISNWKCEVLGGISRLVHEVMLGFKSRWEVWLKTIDPKIGFGFPVPIKKVPTSLLTNWSHLAKRRVGYRSIKQLNELVLTTSGRCDDIWHFFPPCSREHQLILTSVCWNVFLQARISTKWKIKARAELFSSAPFLACSKIAITMEIAHLFFEIYGLIKLFKSELGN